MAHYVWDRLSNICHPAYVMPHRGCDLASFRVRYRFMYMREYCALVRIGAA